MNTTPAQRLSRSQVTAIVVEAIKDSNELRSPDSQLSENEDAQLFGGEGRLDSMGLVALLMDIEELLLDAGADVSLSSEDAMSRSQSPYRDIRSLVDYIQSLCGSPE